jgi:hypothetical protein
MWLTDYLLGFYKSITYERLVVVDHTHLNRFYFTRAIIVRQVYVTVMRSVFWIAVAPSASRI